MAHVLQEVTADAVEDRAPLGPAPLLLGAGGRADVVLTGDGVSVRHARVGLDAAGAWVRDLGSTDGTRVNGRLVDGRHALGPDDLVGIGPHLLRVRASTDRTTGPGPALAEALGQLPAELAERLRAEVMADRWEADAWRAIVAEPGAWIDRIDDRDDLLAAIEAQLRAWDVDPGRRRLDEPGTLVFLAEGREPAEARRIRALQRWVSPLLDRAVPVRDLRDATKQFQQAQLDRALRATGGNRAAAAERLGVSRQFVYRLLDARSPEGGTG